MRLVVAAFGLGLIGLLPVGAATPPATVNYQGVLRDQSDKPLSGTYDMVLRFFDAATAGNEVLVDQHATASANAVTVSGGLFNVALGSGTITDGSGPGTYTSLDAVFRDYGSVWLEVQVGGETLSPRTPIQSAPYALNSTQLAGHPDSFFLDTSSTPQEKEGPLLIVDNDPYGPALDSEAFGTGIYAYSENNEGIVSESLNGSAGRFIGSRGIFVTCSDPSCTGVVSDGSALGFYGGGSTGGRFVSLAGPTVEIATPTSGIVTGASQYGVSAQASFAGVNAFGGTYGGSFTSNGTGISASGTSRGGYFQNGGAPTTATLADGSTGTGITASGTSRGGYFQNGSAVTTATLADGSTGISASGPNVGGYFSNGAPNYAYTQIPYFDLGIWAYGSDYGGQFNAFSTGNFAQLAYSSYKILGTGVVSFVQNHPDDPSKVIVYVAPEGDEAAVYTRGSGKLVNGEARVRLGETFSLVANPDIGLTATVTPRGEPIPLAVSDVSPGEVVVRGPAGSNAEFDYMVWGLRIGFEEQSIVQPKKEESKIPSMHEHEKFFSEEPALRKYTALARFEGVEEAVHGRKNVDHARADRLRNAVGVFPYRDPAEFAHEPGRPTVVPGTQPAPAATGTNGASASGVSSPVPAGARASQAGPAATVGPADPTAVRNDAPGVGRPEATDLNLFAAEGIIEAGDVVSLTPAAPGSVTRSAGPGDALVIGCAQPDGTGATAATPAAGSTPSPRGVAVATSHMALCRVDASYGAIAVGDRLSPSPGPGLAMRLDPEVTGSALLGRAIDPLPSGVGLIRVLLGGR